MGRRYRCRLPLSLPAVAVVCRARQARAGRTRRVRGKCAPTQAVHRGTTAAIGPRNYERKALVQQFAGRYSRHTVWLFALVAVALGLGAAVAFQGLGPKVTSAVYAAIVGLCGFAATFSTKARTRGAVGAFLVAALIAAAAYYAVISYVFSAVTTGMTDAVAVGDGAAQVHDAGVKMGTFFGRFFGAFAAVVAFLETSIVGIGGAIAGARVKAQMTAGGASGGKMRLAA
jgi:hypothetical protein